MPPTAKKPQGKHNLPCDFCESDLVAVNPQTLIELASHSLTRRLRFSMLFWDSSHSSAIFAWPFAEPFSAFPCHSNTLISPIRGKNSQLLLPTDYTRVIAFWGLGTLSLGVCGLGEGWLDYRVVWPASGGLCMWVWKGHGAVGGTSIQLAVAQEKGGEGTMWSYLEQYLFKYINKAFHWICRMHKRHEGKFSRVLRKHPPKTCWLKGDDKGRNLHQLGWNTTARCIIG